MSEYDRVKWDARYRDVESVREPSLVITSLGDLIPRKGRALDLAGGTGRHAIWLAQRGLDVTLADISSRALELAIARAAEAGVQINTLAVDLEEDPFPAGPWDIILSCCYLRRSLFSQFAPSLAHDGRLIYLQPTRNNLTRHAKPPEAFLLDDGELPQLCTGLQILEYREGWLEDGRHDALLVARAATLGGSANVSESLAQNGVLR